MQTQVSFVTESRNLDLAFQQSKQSKSIWIEKHFSLASEVFDKNISDQKLLQFFFSYLNTYLVLGLLRHVLAKVWKASKTRRKESWPHQLTYHLIRKVFVHFEIECYEWLPYDGPKWQWVLGRKNRLIEVYPLF